MTKELEWDGWMDKMDHTPKTLTTVTGGPLQVWSHVGSTGFILIFAFLMSPYNAFLRFMLRRAAIWEKFSFAQNHSLC